MTYGVDLAGRDYWECGVCGYRYYSVIDALTCEAIPVQHDKGVKVGDIVLVHNRHRIWTAKAEVTKVEILGNNSSADYRHSVCLDVKYIDDFGSAWVTWKDYDVIKNYVESQEVTPQFTRAVKL